MKKGILISALALAFNIATISTAVISMTTVSAYAKSVEILNVSYDPTREFYEEYNKYFAKTWKEKTGDDVKIKQSHSGSGKQARSVIDGLEADVVTLALAYDIDVISSKTGLIEKNWQASFPSNSSPYTSTVVFLVRKGNPKNIKDWNDIARDGISVITPNPKTSGGARWNYMAALAYANKKFDKNEEKSTAFLKKIFDNVTIYDTGARSSTITFAKHEIGDVLIAWENEVMLTLREFGKDKFQIVTPSVSILAQPSVAVVSKFTQKHNTPDVSKAYIDELYSVNAQEIIAKHFYRPINPQIAKKYNNKFSQIDLVSIDEFGGWQAVQKKHFDNGGVFDQISKK